MNSPGNLHQSRGYNPLSALLDFSHPHTNQPIRIMATAPKSALEVRAGRLYKDSLQVGDALDIFEYLKFAHSSSTSFFPAFIGYFSYEFSRYLGMRVHEGPSIYPDAFFYYFDDGIVIEEGAELCSSKSIWPLSNTLGQSFEPGLSKERFFEAAQQIKERIRAGELYQVNFSMPFHFAARDEDMPQIYEALRHYNRAPFMGLFHHDDTWIMSGSPERLFSYYQGEINVRPIAGTKARHHDRKLDDEELKKLLACPKENAEHAMLVDLMRNDMNRVCEPNSVYVSEDRSVEFYSHVMHLVSNLKGYSKASLKDVFASIFPGGTITGAPKSSVTRCIAQLEASPRGPYTGSLGYVSSGFGADFNILIRSIYQHKGHATINSGAGIVIDSDVESEWLEVQRKAQAVRDLIEHKREAKPARANIIGEALRPHRNVVHYGSVQGEAHCLFIENQDSFSFNIIDALKGLGAKLSVLEPNQALLKDWHCYSHVVIGPGPGNPDTMPELGQIIERAMRLRLPLLGICLGHQAIGHYFGAAIIRLPEPVHGKPHALKHFERGLFKHLPSPTTYVRYHSLAIASVPENFSLEAHSDDDVIMAIRHRDLPIFGVQFHPESYLSLDNNALLYSFLQEVSHGYLHPR